ncbi:hypothetical protein EBU94_05955, partial [bacterium]|nr:hypothetical protein [bacterium]
MNLRENIKKILREEINYINLIRRRIHLIDSKVNEFFEKNKDFLCGDDFEPFWTAVKSEVVYYIFVEFFLHKNLKKEWEEVEKFISDYLMSEYYDKFKRYFENKCDKNTDETEDEELSEYSRTLKNARQQGVGLRFPKSAIK